MTYINFEITDICVGWFDVAFITEGKNAKISASYAYGNDAPKYFLRMLIDALENKADSLYVTFDEEPGVYIVSIQKNQTYELSVMFSEYDEGLTRYIPLQGSLTIEQLKNSVPEIEEMFFESDFSLVAFCRAVLRSFEEYLLDEQKVEYEENWMEFPDEEFYELKRILDSVQ